MSPAHVLVQLLEELERAGTTVMDLVSVGRRPQPWTLYPDEYGVFDRTTRNQFYFHVRTFRVDERRGDPRLIRFVNLMCTVFRPEMEALQEEKDRALTAHRLARPDVDPFGDHSLEVLSRVAIDVRDDACSRRPAREHHCSRHSPCSSASPSASPRQNPSASWP